MAGELTEKYQIQARTSEAILRGAIDGIPYNHHAPAGAYTNTPLSFTHAVKNWNGSADLFQHAALYRPELDEAKEINLLPTLNMARRDIDYTSGLARMKLASLQTASELVSGEAPRGAFYVAVDQLGTKDVKDYLGNALGSKIKRGVPYQFDVSRTADGRFDIAGMPHDLLRPSERDFFELRGVSEDQAKDFLAKFVAPKGADKASARLARAQILRVAHDRARVQAEDILNNPLMLRDYITTGKLFDTPIHTLDGADLQLRRYQDAILNRALGSLRGRAGGRVLATMGIAQRRAAEVAAATGGDAETLFKNEWRRFTTPTLHTTMQQGRWAVNPGLNGSMVRFFNLKALRSNTGDTSIAQLLIKRAREMEMHTRRGAFARLAASSDERTRINAFLRHLDSREARLFSTDPSLARKSNGKFVSAKRELAFKREYDRWQTKLVGEYNTLHPENPLELHVRLGRDRSGIGHGVYFTLKQNGEQKLESWFPILDERGYFTSITGRKFVGRSILVDKRTIDQAAAANWMKRSEMVSQGLKMMTSQATLWGKGEKLTYEFSAQQALVAAGDFQRRMASDALKAGDFGRAEGILNSRIGTAENELGTAQSVDYTMSDWAYRRSMSTPIEWAEDFFDIGTLDKNNVNFEKLANVYYGNFDSYAAKKDDLKAQLVAMQAELQKRLADKKIRNRNELIRELRNLAAADTSYAATKRLNNAMRMVERVPGMSILGREAAADYTPFMSTVTRYSLPGGITRLRPHQLMKNIPLRATADPVAGQTLWGLHGMPEIASAERWRNIHVGVAFSGQELDEFGNPIGRVYSGEEMMQLGKFYEQQVIAKPGLAGAFGFKSVNNLKLDFDTTKGTINYTGVGNTLDFDHDQIQALIGVDAKKLLDKHDSSNMFVRGWLNRLLTEAGDDSDFVKERLGTLFGPGTTFSEGPAGLRMRTDPGSTLMPRLEELSQVIDDLNARREARGAERMRQFDAINMRMADGRRFRIDVAHLLTPTSILSDSDPSTSLSASELGNWWGKYRPLGARTTKASTDAMMLQRIKLAGAPSFAQVMADAAMGEKLRSGVIYRMSQFMAAFGGTFGRAVDEGVDQRDHFKYLLDQQAVRKVTMDELIAAGRNELTGDILTREEYLRRYGTGAQGFDLARPVKLGDSMVRRIVMPDELGTPEEGGYRPTLTQTAADRVIRANERVMNGGGKPAENELQRAVSDYHDQLLRVQGNKKGLVDQMVRRVEIAGQGVSKAKFGYNMLVGMTNQQLYDLRGQAVPEGIDPAAEVVRPGDTVISREVAENMGLVDPVERRDGVRRAKAGSDLAAWRRMNDERGFAYGGALRDPSVQQGGFLTRFVIDPLHGTEHQMESGKAFVHEMWRDPANADFDGDAGRLFAAGFLGKSKPSLDAIKQMEAEIEASLQTNAEVFRAREAAKAKLAASEEVVAITSDMIGNKRVSEILAGKDIGRDMFNPLGMADRDLKLAERDYRKQRDTALTQGLIGSLTDPLQSYTMQQAFLAQDDVARRMWEDIYSNWGILREGVLKVKSNKKIDSHAISAGIRGNLEDNPDAFAQEVLKSFVEPAEKKGDHVEAARYGQLAEWVRYMHGEYGNDWFNKKIRPETGEIASAIKSTSEFAYNKSIASLHDLLTGRPISGGGASEEFMRYAQSYLTLSAAEQEAAEPVVEELEIPPATNPVETPAVFHSAPPAPELILTQPGPAASMAEADAGRMVETAAEEVAGKPRNPWVLAGAATAAALAGAMVFSHSGGDAPAASAPSQRQAHRVIPDQGYNIQVTATDPQRRSGRDYAGMTAQGTQGQLNVHIDDKRDRDSKAQQQQAAIDALKGR